MEDIRDDDQLVTVAIEAPLAEQVCIYDFPLARAPNNVENARCVYI